MEDSLFGKLSGELRNNIYHMALFEPRGFHFCKEEVGERFVCYYPAPDSRPLTRKSKAGRRHILALTETCETIRRESVSLFFAINNFHIDGQLQKGLYSGASTGS